MNTTAQAATAIFDAMERDDRWEGFGYLGARRNLRDSVQTGEFPAIELLMLEATDTRVVEMAREAGLDDEALFEWANSKNGRWFADVVFGGSGRFDERIAEAVRFNLTPKGI